MGRNEKSEGAAAHSGVVYPHFGAAAAQGKEKRLVRSFIL